MNKAPAPDSPADTATVDPETRERILRNMRLAHDGERPPWVRTDAELEVHIARVAGVLAQAPEWSEERYRRIAELLKPRRNLTARRAS